MEIFDSNKKSLQAVQKKIRHCILGKAGFFILAFEESF